MPTVTPEVLLFMYGRLTVDGQAVSELIISELPVGTRVNETFTVSSSGTLEPDNGDIRERYEHAHAQYWWQQTHIQATVEPTVSADTVTHQISRSLLCAANALDGSAAASAAAGARAVEGAIPSDNAPTKRNILASIRSAASRALTVLKSASWRKLIGVSAAMVTAAGVLLAAHAAGMTPQHSAPVTGQGHSVTAPVNSDAACVPVGDSASEMTAAFAGLASPEWNGGDAGMSVTLHDGRTLWLFGDTFKGAAEKGAYTNASTMVHNSAVFSDNGCLIPADNSSEILPGDGALFYWPTSATVLTDGSVAVFAAATQGAGAGMNFAHVGVKLFVLKVEGNTVDVTHERMLDHVEGNVQWGAGVAKAKNGYLVYGTQVVQGEFGKALHVAWTPELTAEQSTWEGRSKNGWRSGLSATDPIVPASAGVASAVSAVHGTTTVVSKGPDGEFGSQVSAWTLNLKEFTSTRSTLFESRSTDTNVTYLPYVHAGKHRPTVAKAPSTGRQVMVGVSNNSPSGNPTPEQYRPTFKDIHISTSSVTAKDVPSRSR